jgi:hypothetical protein
MPDKITLYLIFAVADEIGGQPFDQRVLPYAVVEGVTIEDVRPLFTEATFNWVKNELEALVHDRPRVRGDDRRLAGHRPDLPANMSVSSSGSCMIVEGL